MSLTSSARRSPRDATWHSASHMSLGYTQILEGGHHPTWGMPELPARSSAALMLGFGCGMMQPRNALSSSIQAQHSIHPQLLVPGQINKSNLSASELDGAPLIRGCKWHRGTEPWAALGSAEAAQSAEQHGMGNQSGFQPYVQLMSMQTGGKPTITEWHVITVLLSELQVRRPTTPRR